MKTKVVKDGSRYLVMVKSNFFSKWNAVGDVNTGLPKRYCVKKQADYVAEMILEGKCLWKKAK